MATKKVGELIKEARTKAGLSQAALAEKVEGTSASDIGKAERGEKDLTNEQLKQIAKATGVTQKSLLEAPKSTSSKTTKTTTTKTTTSKPKTTAKTTTAKTTKTSSTAAKTTSTASKTTKTSSNELTLTATEKSLVQLYRKADSDTKKAAMALLKGEKTETNDILSSLLNSAIEKFASGKK